MKLQMQFPELKGHEIYDGKEHTINPTMLNEITDLNVYLLNYFDEKYNCYHSTLLTKEKGILKNMPLLNYDLLYEMVENKQLTLKNIDISILETYAGEKAIALAAISPPKNIIFPLRQSRKSIIIYIDSQNKIWVNIGNGFEKINSSQLFSIMHQYDIEWRNKEDNLLATEEKIAYVIAINSEQHENITINERYKFENIHNYSIEHISEYEKDSKKKR